MSELPITADSSLPQPGPPTAMAGKDASIPRFLKSPAGAPIQAMLCHVAIRPIATRAGCETVGQAGVSALATSLRSDTGPLYGRSPLVDLVLEKTGEIFRAAPLRSDDLDTETLEPLTK